MEFVTIINMFERGKGLVNVFFFSSQGNIPRFQNEFHSEYYAITGTGRWLGATFTTLFLFVNWYLIIKLYCVSF